MTGHGFRGVASTILHEHIELQLAHQKRDDDTSAAYNRALYLVTPRVKMMQACGLIIWILCAAAMLFRSQKSRRRDLAILVV